MHPLRNVLADLSDLRRNETGAQQSPRAHRTNAPRCRRQPRGDAGVRPGTLLWPRLPHVRNRVPRRGALRGNVRTRAGRHRTGWRYAKPATRPCARVDVAVAVYASASIAGRRPAGLVLPGQRAGVAGATLETDRAFAAAVACPRAADPAGAAEGFRCSDPAGRDACGPKAPGRLAHRLPAGLSL